VLQPLGWHCVECAIHHERGVREEQHHIYVARTSNNRVISSVDLYCCSLPQCEALRICRSGFLIAAVMTTVGGGNTKKSLTQTSQRCLYAFSTCRHCIIRETMTSAHAIPTDMYPLNHVTANASRHYITAVSSPRFSFTTPTHLLAAQNLQQSHCSSCYAVLTYDGSSVYQKVTLFLWLRFLQPFSAVRNLQLSRNASIFHPVTHAALSALRFYSRIRRYSLYSPLIPIGSSTVSTRYLSPSRRRPATESTRTASWTRKQVRLRKPWKKKEVLDHLLDRSYFSNYQNDENSSWKDHFRKITHISFETFCWAKKTHFANNALFRQERKQTVYALQHNMLRNHFVATGKFFHSGEQAVLLQRFANTEISIRIWQQCVRWTDMSSTQQRAVRLRLSGLDAPGTRSRTTNPHVILSLAGCGFVGTFKKFQQNVWLEGVSTNRSNLLSGWRLGQPYATVMYTAARPCKNAVILHPVMFLKYTICLGWAGWSGRRCFLGYTSSQSYAEAFIWKDTFANLRFKDTRIFHIKKEFGGHVLKGDNHADKASQKDWTNTVRRHMNNVG